MSQAVKFWDGLARKYAKNPVANEAAYQQTLDSVKSHLTPTSRVLEIGCGTGSTCLKLAPHCGYYLGTDFSKGMIDICKEKLEAAKAENDKLESRAHFAVGDICRADGHEASTRGTYDVALAFNLIYLLEDPAAAMRNVNSMLKPGGLFISKNIVSDQMGIKFRLMSSVIPLMTFFGFAPAGVKIITAQQLESTISGAGFEISESITPKGDDERRYIVAKKTTEV